MSKHLSSERICAWMIGGDMPHLETQHVRECEHCQAEVARLSAALASFRGAARHWSEQQMRPSLHAKPARVAPGAPRLRWALLVAAVLLLALVPMYMNRVGRQQRLARTAADEALLEQVDAEVSQSIPSPMQPLMQLVPWASDSSRESNGIQTDEKTTGGHQ